jgi:predicted DNA-binding mobile mystery protein A
MKNEYRNLRLKQLAKALSTFDNAKQTPRPSGGWLRAIREALGVPQTKIANVMHVKQQSIVSFEKAEADDRITISNLRRVAEAMGCELVYAIVPKSGSIQELAESRARAEATKRVLSVHRTMALEDQASGDVKEMIDKETKRIIEKS